MCHRGRSTRRRQTALQSQPHRLFNRNPVDAVVAIDHTVRGEDFLLLGAELRKVLGLAKLKARPGRLLGRGGIEIGEAGLRFGHGGPSGSPFTPRTEATEDAPREHRGENGDH